MPEFTACNECTHRHAGREQLCYTDQVGDIAYLNMGSYADILINAKNGLMSPVGIIHFPVTGGEPGKWIIPRFFCGAPGGFILLKFPKQANKFIK
jgi:hypothetical protein